MAELNEGLVDILSRDSGELISQSNGGLSRSVLLSEPSVVRVNGTRAMVTEFERQGNDLILHMRDGSVVRYQQFFFDNAEGEHSELVFDDGVNPQDHALFPVTNEAVDATTAMTLTPGYESLASVEPLLLASADYSTGVITASGIGALGLIGAAVGIGGGGGGGGGGDDDNPAPAPAPAPAQPTITLNAFAGDNVLDNAEKLGDQAISGTTSNVAAGQIVTVTLNGQNYQAVVAADGSWSVTVPPAALQAIASGSATIGVSVSNGAATATLDVSVIAPVAGQPTIGINAFAGDDLLDNGEKQSAQTLNGTTSNIEAGQTVTVTLNGQSFSGTVGADGNWSITVPADTLAALNAGTATFTATVSNLAGIASSSNHSFTVAETPTPGQPVITIDTFAGDNVLDNGEKLSAQTLSGTTSNVEAGQTVTVTLNGQNFSATVGTDGSWSISVPVTTLNALAAGNATFSASVANAAGTAANATLTVDVAAPTVNNDAITITEPLSGDGYLNASEASAGLTVSGITSGDIAPGSTVSLLFNNQPYSGTVNPDGSWNVQLPPSAFTNAADGPQTLTVSVTDASGAVISSQASLNLAIDSQPRVVLGDSVFADSTLTAVEAASDQQLQGQVGPGQRVVVRVAGQDYTATVAGDGSWSLSIPSAVLQGLPAGANAIQITVSDVAGNPPFIETLNFNVPPATLPPLLIQQPVAGDGVINAAEQGVPLEINGNVPAGSTVTVVLNGQTINAVVDDAGNWTATIPVSTLGTLTNGSSYDLVTTVTDSTGNTTSQTVPLSVNTTPPEAVTVATFAGDGTLNQSELAQPLILNGRGTPGDDVSVTLNNVPYRTTVNDDGSWSVEIPVADLAALSAASYDIVVVTSNAAGNSSSQTLPLTIDTAQPTLTLDTIAQDGTVNASEQTQPLLVNGTGNRGDTIAVTLNNQTYNTVVSNDGSWSLSIPASDLAQVPAGSQLLTVIATDAAGNTNVDDTSLLFDRTPPVASVNPPGDNGYFGVDDEDAPLVFTGTGSAGDTVTVVLNGKSYTDTVADGGAWTVTVPANDVAQLPQGVNPATVTVTNPAGNSITSNTQITVETAPALLPTLTIDPFTGDDKINGAEKGVDQQITGSTTNVQPGQTITVTLNEIDYTTTVQTGGLWSVLVPAANMANIASDGTLSASVVNLAGNVANASADYTLDTNTTTLSINTIAGDNAINIAEGQAPIAISGSSAGLDAGSALTVNLGGVNYDTTLNADLSWTVNVPAANIAALAQGAQTVTVTAGNVTNTAVVNIATAPLAQVTIITPLGGDGVLNSSDLTEAQALSGTTGLNGAGQAVTVTLNGTDYQAVVTPNGEWSLQLPPSALQDLPSGSIPLTVTLTDAAGNSSTLNDSVTLDTSTPLLTINAISGDDLISAAESGSALLLSGNATPGSTLNLLINDENYQPLVAANGSWSLNLPADTLAGLADGRYDVTLTAIGANGNSSSLSRPFTLDTTPPAVSLNPLAGDDVLSASEQAQPLTLSGTGTAGSSVSATLNGTTYTGVIDNTGQWQLTVPVSDLAALNNGNYPVAVAVSDAAGNSSSETRNLVVNTTPPPLSVDPAGGDGILNRSDISQPLQLSGSGQNGDDVTVALNNKFYFARVGSNGRWSLQIPASDLAVLPDGNNPLTVTMTDAAGNQTVQTSNLLVDAAADNQPTLTVNITDFAGNGVVDAAEQQQPQTLTGTTTNVEAGQTVTLSLNGEIYSGVVAADGSWSLVVPAAALSGLGNGSQALTVSVSDSAGNRADSSATFTVNTTASGIALAPIAGDNYINAAELNQPLIVGGSTSNVAPGTVVTVAFNGQSFSATVNADGSWSTTIPAAALGGLADGPLSFTSSVVDNNNVTLTNSSTVNLLTGGPSAADLNPAFGDGALNAADIAGAGIISGSTGVAGIGQSVSLVLGGVTYSGNVDAAGNWQVSVPAADLAALPQGTQPYSVTVSDIAGNTDTNTGGSVLVDTVAPVLVVATPGGDGVLNVADLGQPLLLNGTSEPNSNVVAVVNGTPYSVTASGDGSWSLSVPAGALNGLADGSYTIPVTATDLAGNVTTQTSSITLKATPPTVTLNPFTGDTVVDGAELQSNQLLSGTTSNVEQGQTVTVTLNSGLYSAVVQASGSWSVLIPAAELQAITGNSATISAAVSDSAGNTASASQSITVDTSVAGLSFDAIAGDNYLNASEAGQALLLSGRVENLPNGATLSLSFNNQTFPITFNNGSWSTLIPASSVAGLADGPATLILTASDAQNNVLVSSSSVLNVLATALPTLAIDSAFGDGQLNGSELTSAQTLSGTTGVSGDGQSVTLTLDGALYTGTVDGNGNWQVSVPATALAALGDGSTDYSVTVSDAAGNSSSDTGTLVLDRVPPTLTIDPIGGDNAINASEAAAAITLSGRSDAESGQPVTLTLNGQTYSTTVNNDGSWSLDLPAGALAGITSGSYPLAVSVADAAGNVTSVGRDITVAVDALAPSIDRPFSDGYLNISEAAVEQTLSGNTGIRGPGQTAVIELNGTSSPVTVNSDGSWSLTLGSDVLSNLPEGANSVTVTTTDSVGNTGTASNSFTVDRTAPTLTIDPIGGDNRLNVLEATQDVVISGTASLADAGQPVNVTLNGRSFTAQVLDDGSWSVIVPAGVMQGAADGAYTVTATLADVALNSTTQTATLTRQADPANLPTLILDALSADGYINAVEAGSDLTIRGGGAQIAGREVSVTFGGQTYLTTADASGNWQATVPAADLALLPDGALTAVATVTDAAGNPASSTANVTLLASAASQPLLLLDAIATDDIINLQESTSPLTISGDSVQLAQGTTVTVTLNGADYSAIIDANGNWSATVPASALAALPQGALVVSATATGTGGNVATVDRDISVNTTPPPIDATAPGFDGTLNLADALAGLTLTGSSDADQPISVQLNGKVYDTLADASGSWTLTVPGADLLLLADGAQQLTISAIDAAGNTNTQTVDFTTALTLPTLSIDQPFGDGLLNRNEVETSQTLSGVATGLASGTPVTVAVGELNFSGVVDNDNRWSVTLPANALSALADGVVSIAVSANDAAGNPATSSISSELLTRSVPTVTINPVFGDNALNAEEAQVPQTISGSTGVSGAGQSVTVTFNGATLPDATVDESGNWSVTVSPTLLQEAGDGTVNVQVTAQDRAGNSGQNSALVTAITEATPIASIAQPAGDGYLNAAEATAGIELRGSTGLTDLDPSRLPAVVVSLNGVDYTAVVNAQTGDWSVALDAATLQALPDGTLPVTVTVSDITGNVSVESDALQVLQTGPDATISLPFGDGALNATEAQITQTLVGSTGSVGAGQQVLVTISGFNNGVALPASVDDNGNWSLALTPAQLSTLSNGEHTITATATDVAGNSDVATQAIITGVTVSPPTVTGNALFTDDVMNIAEAANGTTLTGSTGSSGANQAVRLTIDVNGTNYPGTVDANGQWSVIIPPGALSGLSNGPHTLNVIATDAAGNTVTQPFTFTAALSAPVPVVDPVSDNGYLNAADLADGLVLSGTTGSSGAGQSVSVNFNDQTYTNATVDADGNWRLALTPEQLTGIDDGTYNITVQATDGAGNTASVGGQALINVSVPVVNIDAFTGDNALNYGESIVSQTLTGSATGAEPGSTVAITLNGETLTTQLAANGQWSLTLTPQQMQTLPSLTTVQAVVTDPAGNVSEPASINVSVNLTPPAGPLITLAPVTGDNIINASESGTIALSGTYSNLTAGSDISVAVGGINYIATLDNNGGWTVTVPNGAFAADGSVPVVVTTPGLDGSTVTTTQAVLVDRTPSVLTINPVTSDNVVSGSEANSAEISGTASVSEAGRAVAITLNGVNYSAFVQADGRWSVALPAADVRALADGTQTITAQISDAAGNVTNATRDFSVDQNAPLILVNAFLGDNLINAVDTTVDQLLTGSARGAEGQTIRLYAGDGNPIAEALVQGDGNFAITLTPQVLSGLNDGALVFGLRVADLAGNATEATLNVNKVVNAALDLTVDRLFGDGALNAVDATLAQVITGTVASAGIGATVSTTLAGQTLSAAVGQDGRFSIAIPQGLLTTVPDGSLAVNVTVSDAVGNTATAGATAQAIVNAVPVIGSLSGLLTGDNLLNVAEAAAGQTIGGVVQAAQGSQLTVTLGTRTYNTTVNAGGVWSLALPGADLTSLLNGPLTLGVRVVDPVGNVAQSSVDVGIFAQQPTINISSVFGDGVLNLADIATGQIISGVVNNVAAGSVVRLNVGNSQLTTTVGQNGAFNLTVNPEVLSTLAQGNLIVSASVTDAAGNTATSPQVGFRVDTLLPTVSIDRLFGDGLLNVADALINQTISGVVGNVEPGARVVVSIAGQQLVTTAAQNGSYSVVLTPAILQGIADGNLTVGVSVTDSAGNTNSATAGALVGIHNPPAITLAPLFGDGVLNLVESLVTQTVSGTIANVLPNTEVRINIGDTVIRAVTDANGAFSAQVAPSVLSTLLNGNITVGVSVTDAVGNTSSSNVGVQVGIANQPTLTLNTVFGDGVLSAGDLANNQTISGASTNLNAGASVSVTLNNKVYTTQVTSGGGWTLSVPKADLAALANGNQAVSVRATDAYGNVASGSSSVSVISNTPPAVAITSLFGDNALSVADVKTSQTISGTASNAEGSTVTVRIGATNYTSTVNAAGNWSITVPAASLAAIADGSYNVTASVTNFVGNSGSSSAALNVVSHSTPTVGLNTFFGGDGYLNIAEANTVETISGTSTNAIGGRVAVNVGGSTYTGSIGSNGTWNVSLPSSALKAINDGSQTLSVTVTDVGGNTASASRGFTALSHNTPLVGVDPVLSVVTSLLTGLSVTGGTANAAQGSTVRLTLLLPNGNPGPTVVTTTDALGRFGAVFTPQLLSLAGLGLSLTTLVRAQVIDVAGNTSTSTATLLLGSLLALNGTGTSTLAAFAADDGLVAAASTEGNNTQNGEAHTFAALSTKAAVASTLVATTDEQSHSSVTADSGTAAAAPAALAEDQGYTIGGLVLTLADGSQQEGPSVIGSSGNDQVLLNDLNFDHIDGGAGTDTLVLNGDHMTLDLTALGLKVEHIEVLDLGKAGTNGVKLNLQEALSITDKPADDLLIKGDNGGQVTLANGDGVWGTAGQRTIDGHLYDIYHNSALTSDNTLGDVLVQHNLQVHVV